MNHTPTVIIGTGEGGQAALAHTVRQHGYPVRTVSTPWPRDSYTEWRGRYLYRGLNNENMYAEGGNILAAEDYLILSDASDRNSVNPRRTLPYSIIREETARAARAVYPDTRIHIAPSGAYHFGDGETHIDLFALLLPRTRALLLDEHHGGSGARAPEWNDIAQREGLRLYRHDGAQDGVWYPLNALVLPADSRDLVFINRNAHHLARALTLLGAQPVPVEMPTHEPAGSIHCQTNTYTLSTPPYVP